MLANGMGGVDWAGLPIACALYGIQDVELLIRRLLVIKLHDPKENDVDREAEH